ncbi:small multi-drug export protein [Methanonatronarchaeum sp. AMET-Sl]|uniref:COG2426 family protein n=1 Tax=Methanonatronarchaeum sp. AMET-Sl TaxID=3037654 RepID=UPI00244DDA72|nr:small multi-drug export protein [Methanonatronarchaeum sp. AMET-Sl]WGI18091.1 small multi-drug export protein [Methanonatronarchaeum sp. AMET-Sl]
MVEDIALWLVGLPDWLATMILSMLPVVELRGGLPVAVGVYGMSLPMAYFFSVVGNMIPVPFLLKFLPRVEGWLRRFSVFDRFFDWVFSRTRDRVEGSVRRYGLLGLIPFVAIPLPVTGAWTGVAAAYLFGFKLVPATLVIFLGVLISGVIVSLAVLGVISIATVL